MPKMRTASLLTLMLASAFLNGCSQMLAKTFVNTQPEVSIRTKEYADPLKIVDGHGEVYTPPATSGQSELLQRYAPVIVQGVEAPTDRAYAFDSDQLGQPELIAQTDSTFSVSIDVNSPAVFASEEKTHLGKTELKQLVYVFWYPRHPVGMVEKGDIDGGVLRITLDAADRPSIYEYVMACGCWHGMFVSEHVEAWAQKEFAQREKGKKWFVERPVDNEDDWKVRDIVWDVSSAGRPVVFLAAGKHECLAIQTDKLVGNLAALSPKSYALQDYAQLDALPVRGGASKTQTASMFNPDGLVWGGRRKGEEKMFAKLDHGGWPRRLDAMKIHWDQESWNKTNLLEQFMRLPGDMTHAQASSPVLKVKS